jgi:hypothetical protein
MFAVKIVDLNMEKFHVLDAKSILKENAKKYGHPHVE